MYNVSDAYLNAIKQSVRKTAITGYFTWRGGGSYSFDDSDVKSGSVKIVKKMINGSSLALGGVYPAEFSATFNEFNSSGGISDLTNAKLYVFFDLYTSDTEYEQVPLGLFYVDESTIRRRGKEVSFKACDGLLLFDKAIGTASGSLYNMVTQACTDVGVSFAMTQTEFEALPNAAQTVAVTGKQIQTWRDLLSWIGCLTGSFCQMSRSGALIFAPIAANVDEDTHMVIPVKTIQGNIRTNTYFADNAIRVTRVVMRRKGVTIASTVTVTTYGPEKCVTLELEENPLLSALSDSDVVTVLNTILMQLYKAIFRPFDFSFNGDPALDMGDYVKLTGGAIDTERGYVTGIITYYRWVYRGLCQIKSVGQSYVYNAQGNGIMTLSDDDTPVTSTADTGRLQPKSQIEKRLDDVENSTGTAKRLQTDTTNGYLETNGWGLKFNANDTEPDLYIRGNNADETSGVTIRLNNNCVSIYNTAGLNLLINTNGYMSLSTPQYRNQPLLKLDPTVASGCEISLAGQLVLVLNPSTSELTINSSNKINLSAPNGIYANGTQIG